jgi:hypothetical protein
MSTSIACPCGTVLERPDGAAGRTAPCPRCGSSPGAPADGYDDLDVVGGVAEAGGAAWLRSGLARRDRILVKKKIFSLANLVYVDLNLSDPESKDRIGVASENPGPWAQVLRGLPLGRIKLGQLLPTQLEVREAESGPLLFRMVRKPKPLSFLVTVDVFDGAGARLGHLQSQFWSLGLGYGVFGADGRRFAQVKFSWGMPPRFDFVGEDGRELGDCYPEGLRQVVEGKTNTVFIVGRRGLDLQFADELRGDPGTRLLLLAAVLAMELTGIEQRFSA